MRTAIVGAGITGLTAAAALTAAGLDCDVYEQAGQFAEVGAGLQLAPNATRILHGLGLDLRPVAVRPEAIDMRRWADGTVLRRTPLGAACEQEFGAPYCTVHRADLHAALLRLLSPGVVHMAKRCVRITDSARGVRLRFADGSVADADVLIGADGIHSVVRALLSADLPRFSGHSIYRGLVAASRVRWLLDEPRVTLWLGPGRHCVHYPVRGGELISVGATTPAPGWRAESWTAQGSKSELLAAYAGWDERVTALLAALPTVTQWALHDRDDIARWSRGPIALAGDAAHPMLPFLAQGANQGIEDAMVLASVLRSAEPANVAAALATYERVRRERTGEVHSASRANTDMLHLPDGPDQQARDQHLAAQADLRSHEWLYGYQAERAVLSLSGTELAARSGTIRVEGDPPSTRITRIRQLSRPRAESRGASTRRQGARLPPEKQAVMAQDAQAVRRTASREEERRGAKGTPHTAAAIGASEMPHGQLLRLRHAGGAAAGAGAGLAAKRPGRCSRSKAVLQE